MSLFFTLLPNKIPVYKLLACFAMSVSRFNQKTHSVDKIGLK